MGFRGSNPLTSSREWNFGRHGVCDGLKIRRTWFDSTRFHNEEINALVAQQLARLSYTQRVAGASPAESTTRWEYSSAGRTSVSKTEGRGFEAFCSCKKNMEFVAQLVERQNVDLEVMGSSPIILPKCFNSSVGRAALL